MLRVFALTSLLLVACGRTTPLRERDGAPRPPDAGAPDAGQPVDAGPPPITEPCIHTPFPGFRWEFLMEVRPICFGMTFSSNGAEGEYAFANIPPESTNPWVPHPFDDISFADPSRMCSAPDGGPPECGCRAGGDFTYFQTSVEIVRPPGTFSVTIQDVDDGVRVTLFNSKHPNGFTGGFAFLFGGSTTDFAAETVVGHNRLVLTHVDDCCRDRRIAHVKVLLDGQDLELCP